MSSALSFYSLSHNRNDCFTFIYGLKFHYYFSSPQQISSLLHIIAAAIELAFSYGNSVSNYRNNS